MRLEKTTKNATGRGRSLSPAGDLASGSVAVVLAGGKGTRLDPLTRTVCKPALTFGGSYRCIDFSLSNCVNSGVGTIGVVTQHNPDALLDHLWTHWNSAAVGDDALVHAWRAEERAERFGCCGTADAVYRNLASIGGCESDLVLVLAGDHVYKMDYRPMLEAHRARGAAVTLGCIEAPIEDALELGVLTLEDDDRVERFVEKPRCAAEVPRGRSSYTLASMGIYVFDAPFLVQALEIDAAESASRHDFAADILPRVIDARRAFAYRFRDAAGTAPAYWRDIGTLSAYWRAHMELLGSAPLLTLDDPRWPIGRVARPPHFVSHSTATAAGGTIEDSIVAGESTIAGRVVHCVLSEGIEIRPGAQVAEAVVLPGAVVGAGSRLRGVIVDAGHRVAESTVVERSQNAEPPVLWTQMQGVFEHRRAH